MKKSKLNELKTISQIFNRQFCPASSAIRVDQEIPDTSRLDNLIKLHEQLKKIPTWPFDTKIIRRFSSGVLIPTAVYMFGLIIDPGSIIYNMDKLGNLLNRLF